MCKICSKEYINTNTFLTIEDCPNLVSISNIDFSLTKVECIYIMDCPNLRVIDNLQNIDYLSIDRCNNLKVISNLSNINKLDICDLDGLFRIHSLSNIDTVKINNCNNLSIYNVSMLIRVLHKVKVKNYDYIHELYNLMNNNKVDLSIY